MNVDKITLYDNDLLDMVKSSLGDFLESEACTYEGNDLPYENPMWIAPNGDNYQMDGCFGFIGDQLIIGRNHHQEIMALLINNGWTWEDLMDAEQIWGWYSIKSGFAYEETDVRLTYVSDAAYLHKSASKKCKRAFRDLFGIEEIKGKYSENRGDVETRNRGQYGGDYDKHYKAGSPDLQRVLMEPSIVTPIPDPPKKEIVSE